MARFVALSHYLKIPTPEMPQIDAAPQVELPAAPENMGSWPVPVAISAGVLLLVVTAVVFVLNRRKKQLPPMIREPEAEALRQLHELRAHAREMAAASLTRRVSEVVRVFLHRQFGVEAPYQTSEEILALRKRPHLPPPPPAVLEFQNLLLECDRINYSAAAEAEGSPESFVDQAVNVLRRSVDRTRQPALPSPPSVPPPISTHAGISE